MFKYNLGQKVYYMINNKIGSKEISSRCIVENMHDDWASTKEQKESWQPFGKTAILYSTGNNIFNENEIFESKEDLVKNLFED